MKSLLLVLLLVLSGCRFNKDKSIEVVQDVEEVVEDTVELIVDAKDVIVLEKEPPCPT